MSFSKDVKEEVVKNHSDARHCQMAELAAILIYSGSIQTKTQFQIDVSGENDCVVQKCKTLLTELLDQEQALEDVTDKDYSLQIQQQEIVKKVAAMLKMNEECEKVHPLLIKNSCCKRAFLRGAFLSLGSMSNPEKSYHLEFASQNIEHLLQIQDILKDFDIFAKMTVRKKYHILYVKESEEIVELLNVIGAHISLMNLENMRILKDMRNSINRKVNCEAANITKTVNAATKQMEDIRFLREHYGFERLSDHLREMAEVRLEYPDASLKELGECLQPPVGKSGVNHRLRKLGELAERIREEMR